MSKLALDSVFLLTKEMSFAIRCCPEEKNAGNQDQRTYELRLLDFRLQTNEIAETVLGGFFVASVPLEEERRHPTPARRSDLPLLSLGLNPVKFGRVKWKAFPSGLVDEPFFLLLLLF